MSRHRRVAMQLELEWPFKRHAGIFAGTQKYAGEHSWQSIVDENPDATLQKYSGNPASYDGIIARATGNWPAGRHVRTYPW